jgi:hypothetical protein
MYVVGNAEVGSAAQAAEIAGAVDGIVEFILMDGEQHRSPPYQDTYRAVVAMVKKSQILTYRDSDAHVDAAEALIAQLLPDLPASSVCLCGLSSFAIKLGLRLIDRSAKLLLWDEDQAALENAEALISQWADFEGFSAPAPQKLRSGDRVKMLVGGSLRRATVHAGLVEHIAQDGILLDAGVGSLTAAAVEEAICRGLSVYRLDMRAGLSGQIAVHLETLDWLRSVLGAGQMDGVSVVAGGAIGARGSVVVDDIRQPTRVIGIADGRGGLLPGVETLSCQQDVARVKQEMLRRRL